MFQVPVAMLQDDIHQSTLCFKYLTMTQHSNQGYHWDIIVQQKGNNTRKPEHSYDIRTHLEGTPLLGQCSYF